MFPWILFTAGSFVLVIVSLRSLRHPGSHGFYRFFSWEAILALLLLNARSWFYKPFAWNQIIAWILLLVSLVPLILGVHALRSRGKPAAERKGEPSLLAFEKTTRLVTSGVYQYIRHPLYSSLFLFAWGTFFKSPGLLAGILSMLSTLFLTLTANADETECTEFFGQEYTEYMKHTKRFIPYVL